MFYALDSIEMKGLLFLGFCLTILFVAVYALQKEGFANPEVTVPKTETKPTVLEGTSPDPYVPSIDKVYAPASGDVSKVNSLPYKDPAQESAPYKRLNEILESLKTFITFESTDLQEQSDPSVQLPLTTARGDLQRVQDEMSVLSRNPGIDSSLTQKNADDIWANLVYLQKKARNLGGPAVEGFTNTTGERATLADLQTLVTKVIDEISVLGKSGTKDPVLNKRINTLTSIKNDLNDIITKVKNKTMPVTEIPVMKSDIEKFLPALKDNSKPLPQLIKEAGIDQSKIIDSIVSKYGDELVKGLSWNLDLSYTSENELAKAKLGSKGKALRSSHQTHADFEDVRGEFEHHTTSVDEKRHTLKTNGLAPKAPGHLDWKVKASSICDSIRKRGLDPHDFGCIKDTSKVGPDYSWRGNARMVCTRLLTTLDPGLPEVCGCPPVSWPGWRA